MTSVRKPPPLPFAGKKGCCPWCGEKAPPGPTGRARSWHYGDTKGCHRLHTITISGAAARDACLARDGGRCHDCSEMCYRSEPGSTLYPEDVQYWAEGKVEYPLSVVHWREVMPWEAEHDIPLWSVDRSLPWEKLIFYWSMGNILTRCAPCHSKKTALEAKQRAKEARIRAKRGHPDPKRLKVRDLPF